MNKIEILLLVMSFVCLISGTVLFLGIEDIDVLSQVEDISNIEMLELKLFLYQDKTNELPYLETENETFTCFDFSNALMKNAKEKDINLGLAVLRDTQKFYTDTNMHLINYIYVNDKLYFIEPQTDKVFTIEDYKGYYDNMNYITIVEEDERFPRSVKVLKNVAINFRNEVDYDLNGDVQ